ncbi:MAG TPA: 50S ribosomal protein L2 [Candidatus Paceibacterota bacterium]|nr:50S ribosomal protein L2 [Candidatus Paceibacterota bacterium]
MKSYKPTTHSRRFITNPDYSGLSKVSPKKTLLRRLSKRAGRNSQGRITMRHQGGGAKSLYRLVDFRNDKLNIPGRVETVEYDPYRTAFIALVVYRDGERRYILSPNGLKVGAEIVNSDTAPFEVGNRTILKRIPVGTFVHNVELHTGRGGQIGRSAGTSVQILANEDGYTHLKMPSGEVRKVSWECRASIGQVSNIEHNLVTIGKAGRSRHLGIRPTVRASVMNPRDHKYGGGEGRTQRGTKRPKDKWGNITGGRKTRKRKKWSNKMILKRRK